MKKRLQPRKQPPGFRFHPTHVELVMFYLKRRVMRKKLPRGVISELDVYKYAPSDLPVKACLKSGDLKWYFFCPRERKYASGARMNRATESGYWKSTGKDRPVFHNDVEVGQIKTLTFFKGKAPKGGQTDWVMHEYRIEEKNLSLDGAQNAYVLCVIFQKDGPGPRNGAQYGAPFKEEDWEEDDLEEVDSLEVDISSGLPVLPSKEPLDLFAPDTSLTPSNIIGFSSASCISENLPSTSKEIPQIASGNIDSVEKPGNCDILDDLFTVEDFFPENGNSNLVGADGSQAFVAASKYTDQTDTIFKDLGDLDGWSPWNVGNAWVTGHGVVHSSEPMLPFNDETMYSSDQRPYLELNDLDAPLSSTYQDMQMSNAAYNGSSITEQPCSPYSSFGAANPNVPSCQYHPSLHHSNVQICPPTDFGYPDTHTSASIQSAWMQENFHPNSNVGCNGSKIPPWSDHGENLP